MKNLFEKYEELLYTLLLLGALGYCAYAIYWEKRLYPVIALTPQKETNAKFAVLLLVLTIAASMLRMGYRKMQHINRTQDWLIEAVNWNIERLRAHGLCRLPENQSDLPETNLEGDSVHWPWGAHHTEYLGHLDAAARRFWTLYDPADPGTAPTNDMVAVWLHSERGISKEKARSIASMLRPDGLPTGPRK